MAMTPVTHGHLGASPLRVPLERTSRRALEHHIMCRIEAGELSSFEYDGWAEPQPARLYLRPIQVLVYPIRS